MDRRVVALLAFREGHLNGGEKNNSSALKRCALHSTQHALDVNEESTIPYGTGTDESGSRLPDTFSYLAEMQIGDGARTSLVHMTRCGLDVGGPQTYMAEQSEGRVGMEERFGMHQGMPQGNHESSQGNESTHVFCHRRKAFTSATESGDHMRPHGSVGLLCSMKWKAGVRVEMEDNREIEHSNADSRTISNSTKEEEGQRSGEEKGVKQRGPYTNRVEEEATSIRLSSRSDATCNIINGRAVNLCGSKKEAKEDEEEEDEDDDDKNVQRLQYQKEETLIYTLRRNPKRSRRFLDEDDTREDMVVPLPASTSCSFSKKTSSSSGLLREMAEAHACSECGKEFASWKALFGHMRCHPEREWRGIQRPDQCYGVGDSIAAINEGFVKQRGHHQRQRRPHAKPIAQHVEYAADDEEEDDEIKPVVRSYNLQSRSGDLATTHTRKFIDHASGGDLETTHNSKCINYVSSMRSVAMQLEEGVKLMVEEQLSDTSKNDCSNDDGGSEDQYHLHRRRHHQLLQNKFEHLQQQEPEDYDSLHGLAGCFLRGKRSRRSRLTVRWVQAARRASPDLEEKKASGSQAESREERDMANCLVMLALAGSTISDESTFSSGGDETADAGGDAKISVAPLATFSGTSTTNNSGADKEIAAAAKFQCSNCKRSFKSHQALGGHRASHKNVQGCFARTTTSILEVSPPNLETLAVQSNSKGHQCSICFRVFATGQALGGHKRCHWASDNKAPVASIFTSTVSGNDRVKGAKEELLLLDLNLPAPTGEEEEEGEEVCLSTFCASSATKIAKTPTKLYSVVRPPTIGFLPTTS